MGTRGGAISTGAPGTYKANTKAGGWTIEWATNRVSTSGDATREIVVGIDDDTNNIRVQFDADPADGGGVTLLDGMPAAAGGGSSVRFAYDVRSGYHVFRLQRKKGSGSVELYVDDVLAGSITPVAARLPWSDESNRNNVYWGNSHWEEDFDYFHMGVGDVPFTETTATTGADGAYAFGGLALGTYKVTEVTKKGWTQTYPPNPGSHEVNVTAGAVATGVDFGNKPPHPQRSTARSETTWTPLASKGLLGTDFRCRLRGRGFEQLGSMLAGRAAVDPDMHGEQHRRSNGGDAGQAGGKKHDQRKNTHAPAQPEFLAEIEEHHQRRYQRQLDDNNGKREADHRNEPDQKNQGQPAPGPGQDFVQVSRRTSHSAFPRVNCSLQTAHPSRRKWRTSSGSLQGRTLALRPNSRSRCWWRLSPTSGSP